VEGRDGLGTKLYVLAELSAKESRMVVHVGHVSSNHPSTESLPPATMIPFFPAVQDVVQMFGVTGVKLKAAFVPVSRIFRARF